MRFFPDPSTIVIVGGVYIRWYAVTLVLGFILGYLFSSRIMKSHGYGQATTDDLLIIMIVCTLIGGRIGWVLENLHEYMLYVPGVFRITDGGSEVITAVLANALGICLYTRRRKMSFRRTMDSASPGCFIAIIVARIGRCLAYSPLWLTIGIDIIGFIVVWYGIRPYRPGRMRGDTSAVTLMWLGISRLSACVFGLDPFAENCIPYCIIAEVLGIVMYVYDHKYPKIKPLLLFDFDGTIMDSEKMITGCYAYLFQKHRSLDDFTPELQKEVFGADLEEELARLFPDEDTADMVKEFREFQKSLPGRHLVQLMPHVKETLDELKKRGYEMGIVTSRLSESCEMWLKDLEIEDYFNAVIGNENYRHAKPAKDCIIRACEIMGHGHDAVVYTGDNPHDVETGINAGVYTVGFVSDWEKKEAIENSKPNVMIFEFSELIKVLNVDHAWTYEQS
ncbi:MAG: HAD-IA family hydrolase [Erysipelotrichaceae bacterium]|jgi:phosphatidylglycerol:prolipoprotein diacylglycerol transferase|nr:HAD-IA family hydrolase [Erysipelotrichaceae bacterium]